MIARIAFGIVLAAALGNAARAQDKPIERTEIDKRPPLLPTRPRSPAPISSTAVITPAVAPLPGDAPDTSAHARSPAEAGGDSQREARHREDAARPAGRDRSARGTRRDHGTVEATATLWDRLGGEKVVRVLVKEAGTAAASDPKVNFRRGGAVQARREGRRADGAAARRVRFRVLRRAAQVHRPRSGRRFTRE